MTMESYGCQLLSRTTAKEHALYEKILGKPHKTLLSHSFDTAYVCQYLAELTVYKVQISRLASDRHVDVKDMVSFLKWLCAMHDVGKLHPLFQAKLFEENPAVKELLENMYGGPIPDGQGYRHEYGSDEIVGKVLKAQADIVHIPLSSSERSFARTIVRMHHQGLNKGCAYANSEVSFKRLPDASKWDAELVKPFCERINKAFPIDIDIFKTIANNIPYWAVKLCLGILMTCDWISSGERFLDIDLIDYQSVKEYKTRVYDILNHMMDIVDLQYKQFDKAYSYNNLFNIAKPRTMQETVIHVVEDHPDLDCLLIEAPTGEGKSEAALYAAMNLLKVRDLQGIYFALPTGLTSEAMWPRIHEMLQHIGEDSKTILTTGTSWLSDLNDGINYQDMIFRRFRLLERICVGTVDQIMSAAVLSYYSEIKMAAMGSKVVVIDEVHSYDAYMMTVIGHMLKYFKMIGTPVIMLSATLSTKAREKLLSHYGIVGQSFTDSYPKVCVVEGSDLFQYNCPPTDRHKTIQCQVLKSPEADEDKELEPFYKQAVDKVSNGGCLAFIVNSVDCSIRSYKRIKDLIDEKGQDTQLYLLHARFPMSKKEAKITSLVDLFGKNREHRPKSAIVVATPIIEMSMDLDFDFMFRQIAPIDAIIQSMGRIARHDDAGTIREHGVLPEIVVMDTVYGVRIYGDTSYKKGDSIPLLDVTARTLKAYTSVCIPQDVTKLINTVYDSDELAQYYSDQRLHGQLAQLAVSCYTPDEVVSSGNISEESKGKQTYIATRESSIEYVKVAVMNEDQIAKVNSDSISSIRKVYKDTVVSIPAYILSGIGYSSFVKTDSTWFEDVYIDMGEKFSLDETYGLMPIS